jgi:hypothetical protein
MPYCPDCQAEYQAGIAKCADCDVALVEKLPEGEVELREVFRCTNQAAAQRICGVVLHELRTFIRSRASSAFPTPGISLGQEYIAVETTGWERACGLLREAIEDGAISAEDGELIDE